MIPIEAIEDLLDADAARREADAAPVLTLDGRMLLLRYAAAMRAQRITQIRACDLANVVAFPAHKQA